MKRMFGAGLLGLALLGSPVASVFADDPEGEPMTEEVQRTNGSNRNLILAAIVAVVVIGGGVALSRRR